jgi:predicted esterase
MPPFPANDFAKGYNQSCYNQTMPVPAGRFSQSVGLNYRLVATYTDLFRGVIAICGGLPGDWDDGNYLKVAASVLHIARNNDEYYPPEVTGGYADRLRLRTSDVEFHLIEGGHQMPSGGQKIIGPWIRRIMEIRLS